MGSSIRRCDIYGCPGWANIERSLYFYFGRRSGSILTPRYAEVALAGGERYSMTSCR